MKPTLVVMAAGMGSRYGGLKQMDPVGPSGEIALEYAVYDALRAGFGRVVFIIRRSIEAAFRQTVGARLEGRVETAFVHQELDALPDGFSVPPRREKPWGTGHAVLCSQEAVAEPFAVINADDFYGRASYQALAGFLSRAAADSSLPVFCLVGFALENTLSPHGHVARGICDVDADGFLRGVVERTRVRKVGGGIVHVEADGSLVPLRPDAVASMNIWGFTPDVFPRLRDRFVDFLQTRGSDPLAEFYLPEAVGGMAGDGVARVRVLSTPERWFGITYREDRERFQEAIRALVAAGEYSTPLWHG